MEVGILAIFQNYLGRGKDEDMVRGEMRIAEQAEDLGLDKYWPAEHHFTDYSAIPDNIQFLTWLAGKTSKIRLATGAVIVPWNDPLRVVEKITLLDYLSDGRAVLGLGRGLSRLEFGHFGLDMNDSRARFDEGARMIIEALDTGEISGDGPHFPQPPTPIRPRPLSGFRDRFYCVGMSPDSVDKCAELGARLMTFSQKPWELYVEETLKEYRAAFQRYHGIEAPPPLTGDLMFCHEDAGKAKEMAKEYMSNYFLTIIRHYEIMSDHFKDIQGYDYYATSGELFARVGLEVAAETYLQVQTFGTPEQILEKLRWRRELMGDFELNMVCFYGGMGVDVAEKSLKLFSKEVLPELQGW